MQSKAIMMIIIIVCRTFVDLSCEAGQLFHTVVHFFWADTTSCSGQIYTACSTFQVEKFAAQVEQWTPPPPHPRSDSVPFCNKLKTRPTMQHLLWETTALQPVRTTQPTTSTNTPIVLLICTCMHNKGVCSCNYFASLKFIPRIMNRTFKRPPSLVPWPTREEGSGQMTCTSA